MRQAQQFALLEFNRALPAYRPWYRVLSALPAHERAQVQQRAEEIYQEMVVKLCS